MGPNKVYFQAASTENTQTEWQVAGEGRREAWDKKLVFFKRKPKRITAEKSSEKKVLHWEASLPYGVKKPAASNGLPLVVIAGGHGPSTQRWASVASPREQTLIFHGICSIPGKKPTWRHLGNASQVQPGLEAALTPTSRHRFSSSSADCRYL